MNPKEKEAIQISFKKEKIAAMERLSQSCIVDLKVTANINGTDFLDEMFTIQMVGFIYSNTIEERKIEYICERPTFFDWLFRRRKLATFDFKAKDILINPPTNYENNEVLRVYEIK